MEARAPRIFTYEMRQDDPAKCTSAKMRKLGFARSIPISRFPVESIVLNPAGKIPVFKEDRSSALKGGVVVVDCSWAHAPEIFRRTQYKGLQRRLPALLAGNPTNYSKLDSLSSLEAVVGALYIMNFYDYAMRLLSIYKWGDTFLTLNQDPLDEYSKANSVDEIFKLEGEYFPNIHA
ncbi:MAG: DUF367 family protein [Nitrososphaerales archaeon]